MYCRDTREEKRKKKGKLIGHVDEGGGGGVGVRAPLSTVRVLLIVVLPIS